jgi:hypothetical protein
MYECCVGIKTQPRAYVHLRNTGECVDGREGDAAMRWVEDVLAPYVALAPPGIIPVILLDSYRCHIMVLGEGKQTQNGQ